MAILKICRHNVASSMVDGKRKTKIINYYFIVTERSFMTEYKAEHEVHRETVQYLKRTNLKSILQTSHISLEPPVPNKWKQSGYSNRHYSNELKDFE